MSTTTLISPPAMGDTVMIVAPAARLEQAAAEIVGVQEPLPLELAPATLYELQWPNSTTTWHAPHEFAPVTEVKGWLW